jgi:hypothetical protein
MSRRAKYALAEGDSSASVCLIEETANLPLVAGYLRPAGRETAGHRQQLAPAASSTCPATASGKAGALHREQR